MNPIDMSTYPRRDAFAFFSGASNPFYSVTFEQDVTKLYAYTHANGLSFYHALSYLVTKAMNQVQMFRYVVKDGVIYEISGRTPSLTELRKGEEQYYCVNVPFVDDMAAFCAEAAKRRDSQHVFMKAAEETSDLLFISCLPWVDITGLTNPRDFKERFGLPAGGLDGGLRACAAKRRAALRRLSRAETVGAMRRDARGKRRAEARPLHCFKARERAEARARRGQKARQARAAPAAHADYAYGGRRVYRGDAADLRRTITETPSGFPARRAWPARTKPARTQAKAASEAADRASSAGKRRADSAPVWPGRAPARGCARG